MKRMHLKYSRSILAGCIFCFLFAFGKTFGYHIPLYLGFVIGVLFVLFEKDDDSLTLFFVFLCPNTSYLLIGNVSACGLIAIIIAAKRLIFSRCITPFSGFFLVPLILSVTCSCLINFNFGNVLSFFKIFIYFFLFLRVFEKRDNADYCVSIGKTYVAGALFGCIMGFVYAAVSEKALLTTYRYSRYIGLAGDPNYYSATLVFALSLVVVDILRLRKATFVNALCLSLFTFVGLSTLSRGFLLALVIVLSSFVLCLMFSRDFRFWDKMFLFLLMSLGFVFLFSETEIFAVLSDRISSPQDISNGRFVLWSAYIEEWKGDIVSTLFGFGETKSTSVFKNVGYVAHNTYIQALFELGLFGCLSFLFCFVFLLARYGERGIPWNERIVQLLPLTTVCCSYVFLSQLYGENFVVALLIALLFLGRRLHGKGRTTRVLASGDVKVVQTHSFC